MKTLLLQNAAEYFERHLGVSFDALIAPIDPQVPAGKSVRSTGVYSAIEQERRQDDASVPMGAWERDLKRANWGNVSTLASGALQHQSKDMQLVAWLLEAQIKINGFDGIAACLVLMDKLCNLYQDQLYPQVLNGDYEYRANIIHWISEKLLPALRLVPLVGDSDQSFCWSDWEHVRRNEQIKSSKDHDKATLEGVTWQELNHGISMTSVDIYLALQQTLSSAVLSIDLLTATLDQQYGDQAPSMNSMCGLLQQILSFVEAELHKRGVRSTTLPKLEDQQIQSLSTQNANSQSNIALRASRDDNAGEAIRDRADAYARLAETAEFLMRLEPHSPVPYLVRRATEWGQLNTVDLYQELFLRLGGQLNIFEMLGLHSENVGDQKV
ncbi:type VI secretion system protein TssA [Undibacterium sp. Xuan67W]|uniref:type VI secretion system protein TssA n=1 Tax=Undibacterium sp. Xuan67W TaxID=3413057 RepID=UPI003BF38F77